MDPEVADQQLSAYLDGELSPQEEAPVRAALEASPELRRRLEELRRVDRALAGLASREVPHDLAARLRSRLVAEGPAALARAPGRRAPPRRRTALRIAVAAAAAAVLALLVLPRLARRDPALPEAPVAPLARQEGRQQAPEPVPDEEPGLFDPIENDEVAADELELAFGPDAAPGDGAIIEVLDWLEHMNELEESGRS